MSKGNVGVDRYLGHSLVVDPHIPEALATLLKGGNVFHIPVNAGWTQSNAGSGSVTFHPVHMDLDTSTTANSRALAYGRLYALGLDPVAFDYANWDKKLYLIFGIARGNSDAEAVFRIQIKYPWTEGALTATGIGIRVDNLAIFGESYGTALASIDLGVTMTGGKGYQIAIIHYPGVSIRWFVNGVLKGTQSTAANIPSGTLSSPGMVASIINGVTGGVNAFCRFIAPRIWQEM